MDMENIHLKCTHLKLKSVYKKDGIIMINLSGQVKIKQFTCVCCYD